MGVVFGGARRSGHARRVTSHAADVIRAAFWALAPGAGLRKLHAHPKLPLAMPANQIEKGMPFGHPRSACTRFLNRHPVLQVARNGSSFVPLFPRGGRALLI